MAATNPNWPAMATQVAFNAGFATPYPPLWTDLTPRMWSLNCERGRQYELDQNQAGTARLVLADKDERLNPGNTSSPYWPSVLPYRPLVTQAQWPPVPVGGAVNLLNASAGNGGTALDGPYDPGFESYTAATAVPWITAVGGTSPLVTATGPHTGTKALAWSVAANSTPQGASWQVPCIPGKDYITSVWVNQSAADTQQLLVGGLTALDRFQRNGNLAGSFADTGQSWSTSGGAVTDFTTAASAAPSLVGNMLISNSSVNVFRWALWNLVAQDYDYRFLLTVPAVATGAPIIVDAVGRLADFNNQYRYELTFNLDGTVNAAIFKNVAAVTSQVGTTAAAATTYAAGSQLWVRVYASGPTLQLKVWPAALPEPPGWAVSATDTSLTAAGQIGFINRLVTGNTNGTVVLTHGQFSVNSASTPYASTATANTWVRLSATFTATQPVHQIQVSTLGAALTATVTVDDVQHEPVLALNANPSFETGTSNWTANGSTIASSSAWAANGSWGNGGTLSLQVTPNGVAVFAYAEADQVPVTAGAAYLAYGWIHSNVGTGTNTCGVRINWYDINHTFLSTSVGTEVAIPAGGSAYFTNTFTAPVNAAFAGIHAGIGNTPAAGNIVFLDRVTLLATAPSAATTSGPVIYGVHRGFVERWPASWKHKGMYGYAQITSVDAFASLATMQLHSAYRTAVMATMPDFYWTLDDGANATLFADVSGKNTKPLGIEVSPFGAGTFTPNSTINFAGDPDGVGVAFASDLTTPSQPKGTFLGIGPRVPASNSLVALPPTIGNSWAMTVAGWVMTTSTGGPFAVAWVLYTVYPTAGIRYTPIGLNAVGGCFMENLPAGTFSLSSGSVKAINDGKPHFIVGVITQNATTTTATKYVDGVLDSTASAATSSLGGMIGGQAREIYVGGVDIGSSVDWLMVGSLAHVSIWNRALSTAEITALWNAGKGYVGETSGARISRYLSSAGYTGITALDTGQSTMGPDSAKEGSDVLQDVQAVAATENGNFVMDGAGTATFTSRTSRYVSTTAKWALGEQESPYLEDITFDFDLQLVFNEVKVNNSRGSSAFTFDVDSQKSYGVRTYSRDVNVQSDNEAIDASTWILSTHKDPHQRIAAVKLEPSSNPALWPVALGAQIGDRVTVRRRTATFTMQADYFVEKVSHSQTKDKWQTTFELSPATLWPTPWLLENATYGVLDNTTVLGY